LITIFILIASHASHFQQQQQKKNLLSFLFLFLFFAFVKLFVVNYYCVGELSYI